MYGFDGDKDDLIKAAATLQAWITDKWNAAGGVGEGISVAVCFREYYASVEIPGQVLWESESNEEGPTFAALLESFQAECRNWAMFAETNQ